MGWGRGPGAPGPGRDRRAPGVRRDRPLEQLRTGSRLDRGFRMVALESEVLRPRLHRHRARLRSQIEREHALWRSEEHTSELQSQSNLVCRLLLEKKNSYEPPLLHVVEKVIRAGSVHPTGSDTMDA